MDSDRAPSDAVPMEPYHARGCRITHRPPVIGGSWNHGDGVEVERSSHGVLNCHATPHCAIVVNCRSKTSWIDIAHSPDIAGVVVGDEYGVQGGDVRWYRWAERRSPAWPTTTAGRIVVIYYCGPAKLADSPSLASIA